MEAESPRIDELRRRVQLDPASIAFAHLADEHRRAGDLQEAVRVCRAGLEHHPAYLLAHVTLGRALMELEQYPEARTEFEYVLRLAPDNLVALKGMEELQQREGPAPPVAAVARAPLKLRPSTENASPGKNAPLEAFPPEMASTSAPQATIAPPPQTQVAPPLQVTPPLQIAPPPQTEVAFPAEAQAQVTPQPQAEVASPAEAQALVTPPPQVQVVFPSEAEAQVTPPPQAEATFPSEVEAQVSPPPQVLVATPPETVNPALEELQGWLAVLDADRGERGDSRPGGSGAQDPPP